MSPIEMTQMISNTFGEAHQKLNDAGIPPLVVGNALMGLGYALLLEAGVPSEMLDELYATMKKTITPTVDVAQA